MAQRRGNTWLSKISYLDHGRHWMNSAKVLHDRLQQVSHTQANGPVSVAFQLDHFVGTAKNVNENPIKP